MRSEHSAGEARVLASQALLWLEVLTLAIGVLQFAFASNTVLRPLLAAFALALLAGMTVFVRILPALQQPPARQYWTEIVLLTVCVTLLAAATGAVRSALVTLYLIPLAGTALAFGRWWRVLALAAVVALVGFGLGALTPGLDIFTAEFAILLLSAVAPGAAVAVVLAVLIERMQSAVQRIHDLSATDNMTGLLNLRAFEEVLQQEHRKAERFGRSYSLVVVDIDNLSQVNESMGHEAGNQVLVAVAAAIGRSIRASDVAARLGGDEFVVLLIEADGVTGTAIAQRIRNNVYSSTVSVANRLVRANVSLGTANFPEDHLYPKELMILADQRMQRDRELRRPVRA